MDTDFSRQFAAWALVFFLGSGLAAVQCRLSDITWHFIQKFVWIGSLLNIHCRDDNGVSKNSVSPHGCFQPYAQDILELVYEIIYDNTYKYALVTMTPLCQCLVWAMNFRLCKLENGRVGRYAFRILRWTCYFSPDQCRDWSTLYEY